MNKIKIMIVEDELVTAMMICDVLEELGYEVIDTFTTYESAVECLDNEQPDIAILDIQLEGKKSGLDLARYIKKNNEIPFIFLTSKADPRTVNLAKKLNPPAYLMKPFTQDDLYTSIEMALYNFKTKNKSENNSQAVIINDSFFVKESNLFHKIKFADLLFAKSEHVYVELYTHWGKRYLIRNSMNNFSESLPTNFYRVHRSYIVNLDFLESINSLYVIIKGEQIPIGKAYRSNLLREVRIE